MHGSFATTDDRVGHIATAESKPAMPNRREPRVSKPRTKPIEKPQTRRVPPFHVVLENDDHHTVEFVIDVLRKVLSAPLERAVQLTMEAHHSGRAIIWTPGVGRT